MKSFEDRLIEARIKDTKRWLKRVYYQRMKYDHYNTLEEYERYCILRHETLNVITKLDNPFLESIARDRYVYLMPWKDIESANAYSHSSMMRFHDDILDKISNILYSCCYI